MIDRKFIGMALPPFVVTAEAGGLSSFAAALGETDPIYVDEAAARRAGHSGIPLPPTYLFSLELACAPGEWRAGIGIDPSRIVQGEQAFSYLRMAYVGDVLLFETRISDIYEQNAFDCVVRETRVTNQHGEHVADLRSTLSQPNG